MKKSENKTVFRITIVKNFVQLFCDLGSDENDFDCNNKDGTGTKIGPWLIRPWSIRTTPTGQ